MFELLQSPKATGVVAALTAGVGMDDSVIKALPVYLQNILIVLSMILAVISIVNGYLLYKKTKLETKILQEQARKNKEDE